MQNVSDGICNGGFPSAILSGSISRPEVAKIPIKENGDPIRGLYPASIRIVSTGDVRFASRRIESPVEPRLRAAVYERLLDALKFLPEDTGIALYEGLRPLETQRKYFDAKVNELLEGSQLSKEDAVRRASRWVTNPDGDLVPPHSTGGAVDILLFTFDESREKLSFLDLGKFGTIFGPNPHPETLSTRELTEVQLENRRLMLDAMLRVGFANYGQEFWHFALHDQMSAFVLGDSEAQYGAVLDA